MYMSAFTQMSASRCLAASLLPRAAAASVRHGKTPAHEQKPSHAFRADLAPQVGLSTSSAPSASTKTSHISRRRSSSAPMRMPLVSSRIVANMVAARA